MTRWAKDRALEYADRGDTASPMASLGSDSDPGASPEEARSWP